MRWKCVCVHVGVAVCERERDERGREGGEI